MRRVLVIGSGGAGKSTFAARLAQRTGLPLVHLDAQYWQPGWVEPAPEVWTDTLARLISGERWIMDGNYGGSLERRLAASDTVIFLDMPRWLCLWRVVLRRLRFHGRTRQDMTPGCPERLSWAFVAWILSYPRQRRPRILEQLSRLRSDQRAVRLRSTAQVEQFLNQQKHSDDRASAQSAAVHLQALRTRYVDPFYLEFLHGNLISLAPGNTAEFAQAARRARDSIEDADIETLLRDGEWRAQLCAAWFCALGRRTRHREAIAQLLLRSESCFAGQGYCLALCMLDGADVLAQYLREYLPIGNRCYDQLWALGALAACGNREPEEFMDAALWRGQGPTLDPRQGIGSVRNLLANLRERQLLLHPDAATRHRVPIITDVR
jgi:adenylate kinase family enzyme